MKIAYIDLSPDIKECYSIICPKKYGGAKIFASILKDFPNFHVFAQKECFEAIQEDKESRKNCHVISENVSRLIQKGELVAGLIDGLEEFDLIVHPHVELFLNLNGLKAKQVVWSPGRDQEIHENHTNLLLYNDYQNPKIKGQNTKITKFTLGTKLPVWTKPEKKEDFIFQCTRHVWEFCSIDVANFCNRNGIKAFFGGPIAAHYPLLNHIDNINTFYLGEIPEDVKLLYTQKARLYTLLHNWQTPMNLSALEALSRGTPVAVTHMGFWPSLVQDGVNGFFVANDVDLMKAWQNAPSIDPHACYLSVFKYNHFSMIESLFLAFKNILAQP